MGGVSFASEVQVFVGDVRAAVVCTPLVPLGSLDYSGPVGFFYL